MQMFRQTTTVARQLKPICRQSVGRRRRRTGRVLRTSLF